MRITISAVLFLLSLGACTPQPRPVDSDLERQQDALRIIADFSEQLCKDVPLAGKVTNLEVGGRAAADLSGLVARVAGLGFDAAADYKNSSYAGLLQSDLATAFADSRDCRMKVYGELRDKLLTSEPSAISIVRDNKVRAFCAELRSEAPSNPPFFSPNESVRVSCKSPSVMVACKYWKPPVFDLASYGQQAVGPYISDGGCTCTCITENAANSNAPAGSCRCFPAAICAIDPRIDSKQLEDVARVALANEAACR